MVPFKISILALLKDFGRIAAVIKIAMAAAPGSVSKSSTACCKLLWPGIGLKPGGEAALTNLAYANSLVFCDFRLLAAFARQQLNVLLASTRGILLYWEFVRMRSEQCAGPFSRMSQNSRRAWNDTFAAAERFITLIPPVVRTLTINPNLISRRIARLRSVGT